MPALVAVTKRLNNAITMADHSRLLCLPKRERRHARVPSVVKLLSNPLKSPTYDAERYSPWTECDPAKSDLSREGNQRGRNIGTVTSSGGSFSGGHPSRSRSARETTS